jgi:hypothetical protein
MKITRYYLAASTVCLLFNLTQGQDMLKDSHYALKDVFKKHFYMGAAINNINKKWNLL